MEGQLQNNICWFQKQITLKKKERGCHLITDEVIKQLPELSKLKIGLAHLFLKHTSASLAINENCDPDVRHDMEDALNRIAPEGANLYRHQDEGSDDMPAHVKSLLVGVSLQLPISNGKLNLGTWQGIYLNEHRNGGHQREIVVTLQGTL